MIVLGIIVSVVLSAALSVGLRRMDKNESSMEKVKKYAEKCKSDLEQKFKEKEALVDSRSSEFEKLDIQAKGALKRIADQLEEVRGNSDDLQVIIDNMKNIGNKIASYDSLVKNLMEMTVAVEQNLENVKKEADTIEKFNARLATQQKTVDALDRKIADLPKRFTDKNVEQLESIK